MGHRVKVYRLNEQGTWDDLGTGNVSLYLADDLGDHRGEDEGGHHHGMPSSSSSSPSSLQVVVRSEVDPQRQLLFHRVEEGVVYNRQGDDTIITWNDLYIKTDIALSFQEPSGCADVWSQIQYAVNGLIASRHGTMVSGANQGARDGTGDGIHTLGMVGGRRVDGDGGVEIGARVGERRARGADHLIDDGVHDLNDLNGLHDLNEFHDLHELDGVQGQEYLGSMGDGSGHPEHSMDHVARLPDTPSLQNLGEIASIVTESSLFQREAIAQQLAQPGYLKGVLDAFEMAEDIEDEEGIKAGHALMKAAIMLNDVSLLEAMFSDEHIVAVVGALEYDPTLEMGAARGRYREFVQGNMNLKEVVPITDSASRSKIIQAHRIMYVRDTILPKALDDSTFSTLSSMYLFNIVEVLLVLHQDQTFFRKLFDRIHRVERGSEDWRDLISFLQELITLSRHIQMSQRNDILMHLTQLGLFRVMSDSLRTDDMDAKLRAIDAILATAVHDPTLLRSHIQNQDEGHLIFEQLVAVLLHPSPSGLQEQALDVIKILLDPDTMDSAETKDIFCGMFYDKHISSLIQVVAAGTPKALRDAASGRAREQDGGHQSPSSQPSLSSPPSVSSLLLIVDLLSYCISQHSYRIKYCILRSNAVETVLELMERPEKALVGAALRLLKTCVIMKDEFYVRYVLQKNIMERVLEAYLRFCRKENLIHSALLDLLDMLRRDNIQSLLSACVSSNLWEQVEQVECDQVIMRGLRLKHELNTGSSRAQLGVGHDRLDGIDGLDGLDDVHGPLRNEARGMGPAFTSMQPGRVPTEGMVNVEPSNVDVGRMQSDERFVVAAEAMRIRGEFEADKDEEDYFSKLDDEDENGDGNDEKADDNKTNHDDNKTDNQQLAGREEEHGRLNQGLPGQQDGVSLPRLVDYESDDDDDIFPLSAGTKRKPPKIHLNLANTKLQKTEEHVLNAGQETVQGGADQGQENNVQEKTQAPPPQSTTE